MNIIESCLETLDSMHLFDMFNISEGFRGSKSKKRKSGRRSVNASRNRSPSRSTSRSPTRSPSRSPTRTPVRSQSNPNVVVSNPNQGINQNGGCCGNSNCGQGCCGNGNLYYEDDDYYYDYPLYPPVVNNVMFIPRFGQPIGFPQQQQFMGFPQQQQAMISNQPQIEVVSKQITQQPPQTQNPDLSIPSDPIRLNEMFDQNRSSVNYITLALLIIIILLLGFIIYHKKLNN